jgi:hypothetical protein
MLDTGTDYAKIILGSSGTVDVIWSEVGIKPGNFTFEQEGVGVNTKILLNMREIDLYMNGVPGVADTMEGVAAWLKEKIAYLGAKYVRCLGHSAGASAAIGFGYLIDADLVIAVGPEIELGVPRYRSFEWYYDKIYHPEYRNLTRVVRELGDRLCLMFPAFDISDYRHIHAVMETGREGTMYLADMHSGSFEVNWGWVTAASGQLPRELMLHKKTYDWKFDRLDVWRGAVAFEAIGKADELACEMLEQLMAVDPHPGILYRLSAQKALLGDLETAAALWARAIAGSGSVTLGRLATEYKWSVRPEVFKELKRFYMSLPGV